MIQDLKLENSFIATLINDNNILLEHFNQINEEMFNNYSNRIIINLIIELKDKGVIVDYDSLERYLEDKAVTNIDVYSYDSPLNIYNISEYIVRLKELQFRRGCVLLGVRITNDANNKTSDVFEINKNISDELNTLTDTLSIDTVDDNTSLIRKAIKDIEFAKAHKGITGCETGLYEIDKLTGGWQRGNLIILAARPAMGKTSLAICQAQNAAIHYNKNVLFFSLEMSGVQLMKRQISLMSDISLTDLSNDKEVDFKKINKSISPIITNGFKLVDNCYTLYQIKAQSRKENNLKQLDAIYIDYLGLIRHKVANGRSRENEVSEITRDLKALAKELDVPVICLCQLSRAVESRGGSKLPQLSDLRESGAIEQDADIVNFIYRPEYYGINEDENGESTQGKAIVFFAKNRSGATSQITLKFEAELTRFSDYNSLNEINNNKMLPNVNF